MPRKKNKQIKGVADPSSHYTIPPPQPQPSVSGATQVATNGASVDMAIRLQEETGIEVDIEENEEEEDDDIMLT